MNAANVHTGLIFKYLKLHCIALPVTGLRIFVTGNALTFHSKYYIAAEKQLNDSFFTTHAFKTDSDHTGVFPIDGLHHSANDNCTKYA